MVWHRPRVGKYPEECTSLDGLPSVHKKGPFIPGKNSENYTFHETISQFITFLKFIPFRENKYTVVTMPGKISIFYNFFFVGRKFRFFFDQILVFFFDKKFRFFIIFYYFFDTKFGFFYKIFFDKKIRFFIKFYFF